MSKSRFVLLALLLPAALAAQVTPRNILQACMKDLSLPALKKYGEWAPFPKDPAGWKAMLPDSVIRQTIAAGNEVLEKPFMEIPATTMLDYTRNGNRSRYEALSFDKRNRLWDLVLAESMENKGRFTDAIVNGIWSVCEESYWGVSAHVGLQKAGAGLPDTDDPTVDLFTAETATVLAWADYFTGAKLDKVSLLVRKRIRSEMTRRVFAPMLTARYGYLGSGNKNAKLNNWAPWVMSNYLNAVLLLEPDQSKRVHAVNLAVGYIDQYINGLGNDGASDEGPSYWTAAGACVFDALCLLNSATNNLFSVYREPVMQSMASYIYKTHIAGNYFIDVADAPPTVSPDGLMIYRFGNAVSDPVMQDFGSWLAHRSQSVGLHPLEQFHRMRYLYDLGAFSQTMAAAGKEPRVKDVWLPDVQLMAARSDQGLFLASHGGNNGESHNHNDVGDFIVYLQGEPVIVDVGAGTYTARTFSSHRYDLWFNTSPFHNLPTVNGQEQGAGKEYAAAGVRYQATPDAASISYELKAAYPTAAGIKSLTRNVVLDRRANEVQVTDQLEATPFGKVTQSFMTVSGVDTGKPGLVLFTTASGNKVALSYDANRWDARAESIELKTQEDERFKHSWGGRPVTRVLLTFKPGTRMMAIYKQTFKYTISQVR